MTYKLGLQHEVSREIDLLPHEIEEKKNNVLALVARKRALEAEKKAVSSSYTKRIGGLDDQISTEQIAATTGKETRTLMVVWRHAGDRAELVDVKNRERILEKRPLDENEKQRDWVAEQHEKKELRDALDGKAEAVLPDEDGEEAGGLGGDGGESAARADAPAGEIEDEIEVESSPSVEAWTQTADLTAEELMHLEQDRARNESEVAG